MIDAVVSPGIMGSGNLALISSSEIFHTSGRIGSPHDGNRVIIISSVVVVVVLVVVVVRVFENEISIVVRPKNKSRVFLVVVVAVMDGMRVVSQIIGVVNVGGEYNSFFFGTGFLDDLGGLPRAIFKNGNETFLA
jgi:Kef-type K+ transport system membrane component KefB